LLEDSVYPTEDATTTLHTISIDSIKLPNSQPRKRYENTLFLAKGIGLVQRGGMEDHTPLDLILPHLMLLVTSQ
jgi:hypothetical protein